MKEIIITAISKAILKSEKRNQALGNQLGISENRISELKNKKNVEYSTDKLLDIFKNLGGNISVKTYFNKVNNIHIPPEIARLIGLNMIWQELKDTIPGYMEVEKNVEKDKCAENFIPENDINADEAAKIAVNVLLEVTQFSKFSEGELIEKLIEAALEHAMMRNSMIVNKIEEILETGSGGS